MTKSVSNVREGAQSAAKSTAKAVSTANTLEKTDTRGRKLLVRRLSPLQRMRLAKLAGTESANVGYMGYVVTAASVAAIDDEPEEFPMSIRAVEAMIEQLGDEGLEVVGEAVAELNGVELDADALERAKN